MSYPVMPALPISMAKGLKKTPHFNTVSQKTAAGMTSAVSLKPYPTWDFELDLDFIQGNESVATSVLAQFMSIYMATSGGAGLFLFQDPQDNTVTGAQFGTGNGVTTSFQLSRTINGAQDIIQNWQTPPSVYVNGILSTTAVVSSTGVVVFTAAPASGAVLTVTGSFYFLCRFDEDTIDAVRSYTKNSGLDLWVVQSIKFSSEYVSPNGSGTVGAPGAGITYSGTYGANIPVVSTTLPVVDGTATIGTTGKFADAGHIHPTDTSRTSAALVPNTVPASGQILVGNGTAYAPVTLSGPISLSSTGVTSVATLNQNTTGSAASLNGKLPTGSGSCIPTGPGTSAASDIVIFASTGGDVTDSGVLISSLAPKASPTLSGTVTLSGLTSASVVGTNSSGQLIAGTAHTLSVPRTAVTTGSANTYSATTVPSFTPVTGDQVVVEFNVANTGSSTLSVNGAAAATIKKWGGSGTLAANDILAGHWMSATFDGTYWQLEGQLGNANATQLNGVTLSGLATGILKNTTTTGVPTIAVAGTDYVAPSGSITGTAAGLSGTSALPNGTTATTQTAGDNSTKLATTAYVATAVSAITASPVGVVGAFRNLYATATGTNTNVTVTADEVMLENSTYSYLTVRGISLTIACTTSGANGLDTGTVAASTWYSVWVINNGSTTAGLLSLSSTAPTLPSGYTYAARIGWIRTDSSTKYPLSFTQRGRKVQYKVVSSGNLTGLPLLCSGTEGDVTTPTWIGFSVSTYVPTTASIIKLVVTGSGTSSIESCVSPSNTAGIFGSTTNSPMAGGAAWGKVQCEIMLETTTIYVGAQSNAWVNVIGWEDNL